jgi:hypothetical protein
MDRENNILKAIPCNVIFVSGFTSHQYIIGHMATFQPTGRRLISIIHMLQINKTKGTNTSENTISLLEAKGKK